MTLNGMSRIASAVGVLALAAGSAHAGMNSWSIRALEGGRSHTVAVHQCAANPDVLYVTREQILHKSVDGGATWQALHRVAPDVPPAFGSTVAVDPTDCNRVFIRDGGLQLSEDGGRTFTLVNSNTVGRVASAGAVVYYISDTVLRSDDHGHTWVSRGPRPDGGIQVVSVDPSEPDTLVVIAQWGAYRSTDGGASFTGVPGMPRLSNHVGTVVNHYVRTSPSDIFADVSPSNVATTDNGASWQIRSGSGSLGSTSTFDRTRGALIGTGYSSASPLVRSTDLGTTWTPFGTSPGEYTRALAVNSAGTILAFTSHGLRRSLDNGATWTTPLLGPVSSEALQLETSVENGQVFAGQAGSRINFTTGIAPWRVAHSGAFAFGAGEISQIALPRAGSRLIFRVVQGPSGSVVEQSADGGDAWISNPANGLPASSLVALGVGPDRGTRLFALVNSTSASNGLYYSVDAGRNWSQRSTNLRTDLQFARRLVVDPLLESRMFIPVIQSDSPFGALTSGPQGLYRSAQAGITWERLLPDVNVHDVAISPVDSDELYAATSDGFQSSTTAGNTFTVNAAFAAITDQQAGAVAIDPITPSTLYVSSLDYNIPAGTIQRGSTILRSVDKGQTWEVLRSESAAQRWHVKRIAVDPTVGGVVHVSTGYQGVATFQVAPDLSLALTSQPGTVAAGSQGHFDFHIQNHGDFASTGTRLNAQLPANVTASATIEGGSCTVSNGAVECQVPPLAGAAEIDARITVTPSVSMLLPISAAVSAREVDPVTTNNTVYAGEVVDLQATATIASSTVTVGDAVSYSIQIANAGPASSAGSTATFTFGSAVTLTNTPDGCTRAGNEFTCDVGALASGASRAYVIAGSANAAGTTTLTVNVEASSTAIEMDPNNNEQTADLTIQAAQTPPPTQPNPPPTQPNPPPTQPAPEPPVVVSGNRGGGGAVGLQLLFALVVLAAARARARAMSV